MDVYADIPSRPTHFPERSPSNQRTVSSAIWSLLGNATAAAEPISLAESRTSCSSRIDRDLEPHVSR